MVSAAPIPQAPPWEKVSAREQLFVLVTGANSGIGLGICQRLIDEFLATRSLTSHICVIPTARNATKCLDTIRSLRTYAVNVAKTSDALKARYGGPDNYNWKDAVNRVHILSLSLELCDLRGIYAFADAICHGTVSNPQGLEGEYLRNVRVPRLDSVVFNAAYGGWSGLSIPQAVWSFFTKGFMTTITYPTFKTAEATRILNEQSNYNYPEKPLLAEVFCACVFGHYVLGRQLLPVLSRNRLSDKGIDPGRMIWSSSLEASVDGFSISDLQCFTQAAAYESAKRLTDLLCLTYKLPSVRQVAKPFFSLNSNEVDDDEKTSQDEDDSATIPPNMYVTHPGVVATTIFPIPWFLVHAYNILLVLARWFGSPWHLANQYSGGKAQTWLVMEDQSALDEQDADHIKWGSARDRKGDSIVKQTEVPGWGFDGKVSKTSDDTQIGSLKRTIGRRYGAKDVIAEEIVQFEELGAQCWVEMEKLRLKWEDILAEDGI